MITFIDWISSPDHANFNRGFFSVVELADARCHIFSEKLRVDTADCILNRSGSSRFSRALSVLALCWKHRVDRVVFLTYDPLFLPAALLLIRRAIAFEHNTTPERRWSKQGVWQSIFLRGILRMAQFQGQAEMLRRMGQRVVFVGAPIFPVATAFRRRAATAASVFIAPSYRASLSQLAQVAPFVAPARVLVKRAVYATVTGPSNAGLQIEPVEYISMEDPASIRGVIMTVDSRIRGSGWLSDAISLRLPIITTNEAARLLFTETFPDHPFVDVSAHMTQSDFDTKMTTALTFDPTQYILDHNAEFRRRFRACCTALGWPEGSEPMRSASGA